MVNAPAGWAFFVHACDTVSLDRVKVSGDMDHPNNDGIHINAWLSVAIDKMVQHLNASGAWLAQQTEQAVAGKENGNGTGV